LLPRVVVTTGRLARSPAPHLTPVSLPLPPAVQDAFFEDAGVRAARDKASAALEDKPLSFVGFLEGDPAGAAALAVGKGGGRGGKGKKGGSTAAAAAALAAPERKQYRQASSEAQLNAVMATYLAAYNAVVPATAALQLVLFGAARQHVVRIARCLSQPGGHALLMGVGGSGRRSLSRLAATMAGCLIVELDQSKT
jgi:hypothetical protein